MANPYIVSAASAYRARIEREAGVTISVQHTVEEWPDGVDDYWFAWANEDQGSRSRTVASALGNSDIEVLDGLAKSLRVFERVNREAITAPVALGAVRLSDEVAA
jgi:hypothetical protein